MQCATHAGRGGRTRRARTAAARPCVITAAAVPQPGAAVHRDHGAAYITGAGQEMNRAGTGQVQLAEIVEGTQRIQRTSSSRSGMMDLNRSGARELAMT